MGRAIKIKHDRAVARELSDDYEKKMQAQYMPPTWMACVEFLFPHLLIEHRAKWDALQREGLKKSQKKLTRLLRSM